MGGAQCPPWWVLSCGSNVIVLAATRAGLGQLKEIGWGEEEDVVMVVKAMLSQGGGGLVDNTIRRGAEDVRRHSHHKRQQRQWVGVGSSPAPRHQCGGKGHGNAAIPSGHNSGGNVVIRQLRETRAGIEQRDESRWGDGGGNGVALAATSRCWTT